MFNPENPYYDLPKLPISQSLDSLKLYKALVGAAESLAELSATAEHLPNQAALFQSVILLEAKASSEIEQIITTDEKLFGSRSLGEFPDAMTKEVHRYGQAMREGWIHKKPLCTGVIEEICTIIKAKEMKVRKVPGTALHNSTTNKIIYTPPDGEQLLRDLLGNLFTWMNKSDDNIHPIIKAAIAHYQFESIHPFTDGNGRTGRIMIVLYLVEQGLLKTPVLFLSGEILKYKNEYYSHLQQTRETNDFIPYLYWFVRLVQIASFQSTVRANKVRVAMREIKHEIRKLDSSMYSQDLVNALFLGPIVFAKQLVEEKVVGSLSTAHSYLKKLEEAGLLIKSDRLYNRKVGYINERLLNALKTED
ncbi:UNVERIFIED_CONTAM: hypothetical protein GTU68_022541 [Idotea baltica]|nr:hypothetical protein [Idotea baltica]